MPSPVNPGMNQVLGKAKEQASRELLPEWSCLEMGQSRQRLHLLYRAEVVSMHAVSASLEGEAGGE